MQLFMSFDVWFDEMLGVMPHTHPCEVFGKLRRGNNDEEKIETAIDKTKIYICLLAYPSGRNVLALGQTQSARGIFVEGDAMVTGCLRRGVGP